MSCPRCGKPIPPGAAFCPSCGAPLRPSVPPSPAGRPDAPRPAATAPRPVAPGPMAAGPMGARAATAGATSVAADFDAQRRRNRVAVAAGTVLALLAAIFALRAAGFLRLGASAPSSAVAIKAEVPHAAVMKPAESTPAPLQREASRPVMPADVEEWLKHLEKCEKMKVEIAGDQMAEALVLMQKMQALGAGMGLMDPYDQSKEGQEDKDPGTYAKGKVMDFRPRWDDLLTFFNSKVPPAECQPLAADFGRALGEVPGMMGDIGDILNNVSNDPSAALQQMNKFKGGSYGDVDRYFARADVKLGEICAKYEKNKWFNIKADVSGGSPLTMFGNQGSQGGGGLPSLGQ